jgi:hypothetical protein
MALTRWALGDWSAPDVTALAWHLQQMGHESVVIPGLAKKPAPPSHPHPETNCNRALQTALKLKELDSEWYSAPIPVFDSRKNARCFREVAFYLPHAIVFDHGQSAKSSPLLEAPVFVNHVVTQQHGPGKTVALGLFADGTDWSSEGSIVVWYCNLNGLAERHVITAIEKADLCRCGCKGSCTTLAVDRLLQWSFNCAAGGFHPRLRHDGKEHHPGVHKQRAGQPLGKHGALCLMRLDLLGVWEYLGMLRWNVKRRPCFLCTETRDGMFKFGRHQQWQEISAEDYVNEVAARTHAVSLTTEDLQAVFASLSPSWVELGRQLTSSLPQLGLAQGDCLVVASDATDLWVTLEDLLPLSRVRPVRLVFQRAEGAPFKFVSPLMSITGASIRMVCICRLHSLDCGIVSAWCGNVVWRLLRADVFQTGADEKGIEDGLSALSKILVSWWPKGMLRSRKKTWIKQVRMRNIGPESKPFLKFKSGSASKARLCLRFLIVQLRRHKRALDDMNFHGARLLKAGIAFRRVYTILAAAEKQAPNREACEDLVNTMIQALRIAKKADIHQYPKCHMCVHLAKQAA